MQQRNYIKKNNINNSHQSIFIKLQNVRQKNSRNKNKHPNPNSKCSSNSIRQKIVVNYIKCGKHSVSVQKLFIFLNSGVRRWINAH